MKIKTSELIDEPLDYAVAVAEGYTPFTDGIAWCVEYAARGTGKHWVLLPDYSSDWEHGGPIIEREKIRLSVSDAGIWWAERRLFDDGRQAYTTSYDKAIGRKGTAPLVAAMRCYVASKLGDEVEIPEELK